jgi:signal transduction histidine kinase
MSEVKTYAHRRSHPRPDAAVLAAQRAHDDEVSVPSWLRNPRVVDVGLFCAVTLTLSVVISADLAADRPLNGFAYLWAVGLGALMLVRRQAPVAVLWLTGLGYFTYYSMGFPAIGVAVPIAAALFSAAEAGRLRAAVLTGAVVLAFSSGYRLFIGQSVALVLGYELAAHMALILSVIALGHSVRVHREWVARGRHLTRLMDRQVVMEAERQLREERLALARELHDSIGHSLSVASLYTDVAREGHVDGGDVRPALDLVRRAVGESMSHLRSTVSLLRSDSDRVTPGQSLHDLDPVLNALRCAGYEVQIDVDGDVLPLPPEVEAAAFRIVQEAVTNTLKHSDASHVRVSLTSTGNEVHLSVSDNGTCGRVPTHGSGVGLAGMRERAEDLGGSFAVAAHSDGWSVQARLPREPA